MEGLRYHRDLGETEQAAQDESFYMQTFQTIYKVATDKEMERQIRVIRSKSRNIWY